MLPFQWHVGVTQFSPWQKQKQTNNKTPKNTLIPTNIQFYNQKEKGNPPEMRDIVTPAQ